MLRENSCSGITEGVERAEEIFDEREIGDVGCDSNWTNSSER